MLVRYLNCSTKTGGNTQILQGGTVPCAPLLPLGYGPASSHSKWRDGERQRKRKGGKGKGIRGKEERRGKGKYKGG